MAPEGSYPVPPPPPPPPYYYNIPPDGYNTEWLEDYTSILHVYYGNYTRYSYRGPGIIYVPDLRHSVVDINWTTTAIVTAIRIAQLIDRYIKLPFLWVMSVLGVVSNVVIVLVFKRTGVLEDSCTVILVAQAASDFCFCALTVLSNVSTTYVLIRDFLLVPGFIQPMDGLFIQYNCLSTTYLAFERVVSVMFPFHVKRLITPRRSLCVSVGIFLLCSLLQIPTTIDDAYAAYTHSYIPANGTIEVSPFSRELLQVVGMINFVALRPLSVVLVVAFNATIMIKVNIAKKFKTSNSSATMAKTGSNYTSSAKTDGVTVTSTSSSLSSSSSSKTTATTAKSGPTAGEKKTMTTKETKLTRLMSTVSVMFLVCYSPRIMFTLLNSVGGLMSTDNAVIMVIVGLKILPMLEIANSCLNIIIYFAFSSKFKRELKQLCAPCFKRKKKV